MRLVVISPDSADPRETDAVRTMLGRGLKRYHVRKPSWTAEQLAEWVEAFSPTERHCFILHGTESFARRLGLGGAHWRDDEQAHSAERLKSHADRGPSDGQPFFRSRSCHRLSQVRAALDFYDAVFLSPVFRSLSKPGYGEAREWTDAEVQDLLASRERAANHTEVIALGGIQKSRAARCRELGFDGAAALGAIWQAADPIAAFVELRDAFSAFAERPLLAGDLPAVSNFS